MAIKWKLFIAANYVLLFIFLFIAAVLLIFAIKRPLYKSDLITFIPVISGSFIITLNSAINTFIFHRYFPSKLLPKKIALMYRVQTGFYIIGLLLLLFLISIGFIEEIINNQYNKTGILILSVTFFLLLIGLYVFNHQIRLKKLLESNFKKMMTEMIDEIGKDK